MSTRMYKAIIGLRNPISLADVGAIAQLLEPQEATLSKGTLVCSPVSPVRAAHLIQNEAKLMEGCSILLIGAEDEINEALFSEHSRPDAPRPGLEDSDDFDLLDGGSAREGQ